MPDAYGPVFREQVLVYYESACRIVGRHRPHPVYGNTCTVNDHCDALTDELCRALQRAFPAKDVGRYVSVVPGAPRGLLGWCGGTSDTLAKTVLEALRSEAELLVFPETACRPRHPFRRRAR